MTEPYSLANLMPTQPRRRRVPIWAWLVGALAVVAALALVLVLAFRPSGTSGPTTPAAVAAEAGCTGLTPDTPPLELYVQEGGTCTLGSDSLHIVTFAGDQQRDSYLAVARSFGGSFVVGGRYIIAVDSATTAQTLAGRLHARVG